MKDEWVTAALFDDSLVAELLFRLNQSSCQPPPKLLSLPLGWGHRQPRSKPNKKDSTTITTTTTTITTTTTRCSPTTPLSWSGDDDDDDCSNSSTLPPQSSDPSRSKVAFANDTTNIHSNNKKSKKKTFADLKEEESLLLKERVTLKRELASLHFTLKEQKSRSENWKRFKIDLNLQTSGEMCGPSVGIQVGVYGLCNEMEASISDHAHSAVPSHAVQDGFGSSGSCSVEKLVVMQKSCFALPDLNMMPSEEEVDPENLNAIR